MSTISEMIVVLWLVPVAINIILPLAVFCCWSIGRLFHLVSHTVFEAKAESPLPREREISTVAGN